MCLYVASPKLLNRFYRNMMLESTVNIVMRGLCQSNITPTSHTIQTEFVSVSL
jgi:hypothetical protein